MKHGKEDDYTLNWITRGNLRNSYNDLFENIIFF